MNLGKLVLAGLGVLLGLYVILQILTDGGNVLANLGYYLAGVAFLAGIFKPKAGMYGMVVLTAYVDLLKRMLTLDVRFGSMDKAVILTMPLFLLLGICSGIVMASVLQRKPFPLMLFVCGNVLSLLAMGVIIVKEGFGIGSIASAANAGAYLVLLWVVPCLFKTRTDMWRFFRWMIIVFIPVGIVGIKQLYFGYSDFVIEYLMSGQTIEIKQLGIDGVRPFSTMAAPGGFSALMSCCAVLSLYLYRLKGDAMGKNGNLFIALLLFAFFVYAGGCSMKRMPILIWIMALGGMVVLRSWWSVMLSYVLVIGTVIFIGLNYRLVFDLLMDANSELARSGLIEGKMARLGTLNARLETIAAMFDADYYSWFGLAEDEMRGRAASGQAHGLALSLLTRVGALPLAIAGGCGAFVLWKLHAAVIRAPRNTAVFQSRLILASFALALFANTLLGGTPISSYPMNWVTILFGVFALLEAGLLKVPVVEFARGARSDDPSPMQSDRRVGEWAGV